jgi:predicted GIY-YIG superfamily endonuclease
MRRPRFTHSSAILSRPAHVYLLHFPNGRHYIGATTQPLDRRLRQHNYGLGSRYCKRMVKLAGPAIIAVAVPYPTMAEALVAEWQAKRNSWLLKRYCPLCYPQRNGHQNTP